MIEVKAFSSSARIEPLPLEHLQVDAANANPEHYYLYVVDKAERFAVSTEYSSEVQQPPHP
jgi:hypothetical protein